MLLYRGDSVDGVTSPLLVVLGNPPALLLDLRPVLISSRFDAGVEKSMDLFTQFEIAAVEAPSALNALSDVERASPRGEF